MTFNTQCMSVWPTASQFRTTKRKDNIHETSLGETGEHHCGYCSSNLPPTHTHTPANILGWVLCDPKMARQMDNIRPVCAVLPATGHKCLKELVKPVVEVSDSEGLHQGQGDVWPAAALISSQRNEGKNRIKRFLPRRADYRLVY